MNRRSFLKGLAGAVGAAIILPPTIEDAAEVGRKIWALGGIPEPSPHAPGGILSYAKVPAQADTFQMTVRMAWAEMGFRVGDMVAITDYVDPRSGLVLPVKPATRNLYTVQAIDWDALVEEPKMPTFDFARFKELQA